MNVNRKGPHHSNQRPKEYLYANFDRFWRGGGGGPNVSLDVNVML